MKYIRILSGNKIIQYDENAKDLDKPAILFYKDDIKEADTIEELCDFYVVYEKGGGFAGDYRIYKDLELAKYSMDDRVSVLYGAILVLGIHGEPILKPVAQMNDKGKLELL